MEGITVTGVAAAFFVDIVAGNLNDHAIYHFITKIRKETPNVRRLFANERQTHQRQFHRLRQIHSVSRSSGRGIRPAAPRIVNIITKVGLAASILAPESYNERQIIYDQEKNRLFVVPASIVQPEHEISSNLRRRIGGQNCLWE